MFTVKWSRAARESIFQCEEVLEEIVNGRREIRFFNPSGEILRPTAYEGSVSVYDANGWTVAEYRCGYEHDVRAIDDALVARLAVIEAKMRVSKDAEECHSDCDSALCSALEDVAPEGVAMYRRMMKKHFWYA